jgi:hypothetical protein
MPASFPSTPALNDLYVYETKTWQWNGAAWTFVPQSRLVSGTNIKTINGDSILAAGDIDLDGRYVPIDMGTAVAMSADGLADPITWGGTAQRFQLIGNGTHMNAQLSRHQSSTSAASFFFVKSRGSLLVPEAVAINDPLGITTYVGHDGTNYISAGDIRLTAEAVATGAITPAYRLRLANSAGSLITRLDISGLTGDAEFTAKVTSNNGGLGYRTGAGGTVTQATNKSTGVTLNKLCGTITMNAAALAAATTVSFALTNSFIAATDLLVVQHTSGGTLGAYNIAVTPAAGSATISVRNVHTGSLSEAIVLRFALIKGVTA